MFMVAVTQERNSVKKALVTIAVFAVFAVVMLGAGYALEPTTGLHAIEATSPCPVTSCASGTCHGFADVPEPDGVHEMICPEAGCAALECHAWDTLINRYHQASDASLNLWILMPVVLMVSLVFMVRMLSRKKDPDVANDPGSPEQHDVSAVSPAEMEGDSHE